MPEMLEIRLPERVFQDPGLDEGLLEAQVFSSDEEEEEEEEEGEEEEEEEEEQMEEEEEQMEEEEQVEEVEPVEEVEQVEEVEPVEEGDAASSSSLPVWGTLEEAAAAATASLPQSPVGVCPSPTAMAATPGSQSEDHGLSMQDEALRVKKNELVQFLISRYLAKEPITKAEVLNSVLKDYQDHFVVVLGQVIEYLQLIFGLEVKEVDPSEPTYILVPILGLTLNETLRDEQRLPKAGLLVMVLCLIAVEVECAPEEAIWGALSRIGVCPGSEHYVYGEPRELLTQVWVQEGYLEYRQVPGSDPARSEFLWGPRAYAETSKLKVLEYLDRVN
ncbi:hypothetical protein Celaphus_00009615 [Cervus elaphus hippelaphus]|uniref:MAGE domain-containing protein n=1 Tax=Cervus elaphus hippelaphus TaxID=46360 RepID=A0A212BZ96_CEREH|nr:hypothetical protein Celaphus_00009615 [Cervus elaphus hippelaphus]